jgi:hypothetical protein
VRKIASWSFRKNFELKPFVNLKSLQKFQNLSLATSKSWISTTENFNFALNLNLKVNISGILSNLKQNNLTLSNIQLFL